MSADRQFDCWYAAMNTEIVRAPSRALETFDVTRVNYHLVAELSDAPGKVIVREGRLVANKPLIITPEAYAREELEGFGEEARRYFDFLKQNEDAIRILKYGFQLKQEAFSQQIVTDDLKSVIERVVADVQSRNDPFSVVIKGVDEPWDVCLIRFFWMHASRSAPINVRELEKARVNASKEISMKSRNDIEGAFSKAERDPSLVRELGAYLKSKGVFEKYQDRFFKLVTRG